MLMRFRSVVRGHRLAPPRFLIKTLQLLPLPPAPQPQPVLVAGAAPPDDLEETLEYFIDNANVPEVAANAVGRGVTQPA